MQHEFLMAIMAEMNKEGVHISIDTSGHVRGEVFRKTVKEAGLILYDLKIIDDGLHRLHTGASNRIVLENARWLGGAGIPVWVRIPVIPGYTAQHSNISEIADFIREHMSTVVERIDLLGYNDLCSNDYRKMEMDYQLKESQRVKESEMLDLLELMKNTGVNNITVSNYLKGE